MILEDDDDRLVLIAAFRYALGRMSYMPSVISNVIIEQWQHLDLNDRALIKREINEAIQMNNAGMWCDVRRWEKILNLPD